MPLTDAHLRAIGRVTVNFASLEFALTAFLTGLISPADQAIGQTIASQLSFSRLATTVETLFRRKAGDSPDATRLAELIKRASEAEAKRNTIIHSAYVVAEGDAADIVTRLKLKASRTKGLSHEMQNMTPAHLDQIADQIAAVARDIVQFLSTR